MTSSASRLLLLLVSVLLAWPTGVHAQTATLLQTLVGPPSSQFGYSSDVDGVTAVVGARFETGGGAAYVFIRSGGTWQLQQRLAAPDATSGAAFGVDVAVSGDTIAVGALAARQGADAVGGVYVFVRSGTMWSLQAKLVAAAPAVSSLFGGTVDLDQNTIAVGASSMTIAGVQTGAAYLFDRTGTTWTERRILAPSARALDNFGVSVGVSGDTACIGANGYDVGSNLSQGGVFVYTRAGGWALQQTLTASNGTGSDSFGGTCAVSGSTIAVGALGADVGGLSAVGAVYVFTRTGSTWSEQQSVSGDYANAGLTSLGLAGDVIVAGTTTEGGVEGGAYIYRRTGTNWARVQRIGNAGEAVGRLFGSGVSTDGTSVFIGSTAPSTVSGAAGNSVSVYTFDTTQPGVPGAPTAFVATVAGNTVGMSWGAPTSGGAPTGYSLVARAPGGAVLTTVPLGLATSFSASAPNGTYVLAMRASNAVGAGPESAPVTVVLPASVTPPGAPSGLAVSVAGTTAVFTWNPPSSGGAVTNYLLVAGTSPGFAMPVASVTLPGTAGASIPAVPTGTFYVRVLALNNGGTSGPSNEVALTVGGATVPGAPTLNPGVVSGRTVSVSWTPGTGSATSYTLRAFAPSGAPIATVPGLTGTSASFPGVPSGTYELEVLGVNAAGPSSASNRISVVVP